jgi:uncharacterized integral membrane protein
MRTKNNFTIFTLLLIALLLMLAMINFNAPAALAQSSYTNSATLQTTPTPPADDGSEIGSTDGILVMGIVIVLIVSLPLIFNKRR